MHKFLATAALLVVCNGWLHGQTASAVQKTDTRPFVLGRTDIVHSAELSEDRTLNIYLPEAYSPDSAAVYPVIYLLDGSADEDFIHIVGLVQFANFPWVDILPPSIVVGIANVDRRRDFTFPTTVEADKKANPTSGKSEPFMRFIEKELKPYIERNFKTSGHNTLIGQSLGGLLATEMLYKKPGLFDDYIIISPSLWWDNESLLALRPAVAEAGFQQRTRVYVGVGKEGAIMENDARRLSETLNGLNKSTLSTDFRYFVEENHANILHEAVYRAFLAFNDDRKAAAVRTEHLDLLDAARNRRVPVEIYQPAETGTGLAPQVVLFSHGYGANESGSNLAYSYLTRFLAAKGYFVASIQHELPTDELLPLSGPAQVVRRPNWERGAENIRFVIQSLQRLYPGMDFKNISLIGHSNGGDMSVLFAHLHPEMVSKIISLDNRRMPLPRTSKPRIYSLRSSDQPADPGVLPTAEEQEQFGIKIIKLPGTPHNNMADNANQVQRSEINRYLLQFLTE